MPEVLEATGARLSGLKPIEHLKYPIIIDPSSLLEFHEFLRNKNYSNCVLFVDRKLKTHKARVQKLIQHVYPKSMTIDLIGNESLKSFKALYPLYSKLLKKKIDRKSVFVSLGGGTIGDAIGFLASTYLRGVDWINIPTTLLAQVDSSVGGKTGINHEQGKNLIGTFYQPKAVFIDPQFLKTLPRRQMMSGLAETLKYGLILDKYFFYEFYNSMEMAMGGQASVLCDYILRSVRWKSQVVAQDERDTSGSRQILNFGHTFGHALEKIFYGKIYHGEAVVYGMKFAILMSHFKGLLNAKELAESFEVLGRFEVPKLPTLNEGRLWKLILSDKKNERGAVRMVLLKGIGCAAPNQEISRPEFSEVFKIFRKLEV